MSDSKLTRKEQRDRFKRQKQMQSIGIMVLGLLIIVAGFVLVSVTRPRMAEPPEFEYQMINRNTIGDPNAPIVIEEFSSFACIHCRDFSEGTRIQLIEEYVYTGQVYLISNAFNNPEDAYGIAAQAAECAADQDLYWQMHDTIFANFSSVGYTRKQLESMADVAGLDLAAYNTCMAAGTHIDAILAAAERGAEAGITGTPSFLINGELRIVGNREFAFFQQEIELALAAQEN
jgi:protein-disulfide isomerase